MSYIKELRKAFPQFNWTHDKKFGSYFGSITVSPVIRWRNPESKAREVFGNVSIYISGEMYPGKKKNFVYATCSQFVEITPFRCKRDYAGESGKIFESGKTLEIVLKRLKKAVKMEVYLLNA